MAAGVSLRELAEEMELLNDEMHPFLNRRTGELYSTTTDILSRAEEGDDAELEWEIEIFEKIREILPSVDWLDVPRRDSHEDYKTMERFCLERCEGQLQEKLLSAIEGKGAFRRFKDCIDASGIREAWSEFRREALMKDAQMWLEAKDIPYV
jgi:hypothetical protein